MQPPESWLELPDGKTFWLKERCVIGRQPDNDVVIDLPVLSRRHALIAADGGGYSLSDLHSRNGTYVNGAAVARPVPLRDGDEVRLGPAALRFRCKRRWFASAKDDAGATLTQRLDEVNERACWLLLVNLAIDDTSGVVADHEAALRQRQTWIASLRSPIEQNGGRINGYLGDAIFAYWLGDATKPAQVLAALQAIETWRPRSPLAFRVVAHHGPVVFTRSDRGEELTGTEVNFLAQAEKIARGFAAPAMLSSSAMETLGLAGRCECYGRAGVNGMSDFFSFFALPADFTAPKAGS